MEAAPGGRVSASITSPLCVLLERIFRARIQKEGFSLKSAIEQRKRLLHVLRLQNYRTIFPDFWKPIQIATLKGLPRLVSLF